MNIICLISEPPDCTCYCADLVKRFDKWNFIFFYYKEFWIPSGNLEIKNFWKDKNVSLIFGNNNSNDYQTKLNDILKNTKIDIITTYNDEQKNENKEYDFLNEITRDIKIPKIFYGTSPSFVNKVFLHEESLVDITQLPTFDWLHLWDYTTFRYMITDEAQEDVIDPWVWNNTFYGKE
jgi:hypothetical protein